MNIQKISIDNLILSKYNPRKDLQPGDVEYTKLKKSLENFGYVEPVIVNSDMTVIGGHQRLKVLQELGYTEIDCVIVTLDKKQEKALNIALNKISGEWDMPKLSELFDELQFDGMLDFTGFENTEIDFILSKESFIDDLLNRPLAKSRSEFKITDSGNQIEAQSKAFPKVTVTLGYDFEPLDKADGMFIRYAAA